MLSKHFIGLLVLLNELASQLVVFPFQFPLSFVTYSHPFAQILYLLLFEYNSLLKSSQFPLNNAVPGGKCVCLGLESSDCAFQLISEVVNLLVLVCSLPS